MIDKETLNKIAKLNNLRPWQQERHYAQSLILIALSEYPLAFKGGTYLWFFHGLNRFSEDLDFTSTGKLPENLGENIPETLRLFGVENDSKTITDDETSVSFRISANGPLHTSPKDVCHVYIEISKREKLLQKPLSFEMNFDAYKLPVKIIGGMTLDEVAAEKVRALLTRDKARDLYDFAFLIKEKNAKPDLKMVNEKLKYYNSEFSHELFKNKIKEKKGVWTAELKQLVLGNLGGFEAAADIAEKWSSSVTK